MSKLDTYNINAIEHVEMLLEMNQSLKVMKGSNMNNLRVEPSKENLSDRFLSILAKVIDNNLQFLLFQATKLSESLIEIDKKEAIEEAKNFINSEETKQFTKKHE